jgi:hypothetical protein
MAAWYEGFDLPHQPRPVQIPALPAPDSAVSDHRWAGDADVLGCARR